MIDYSRRNSLCAATRARGETDEETHQKAAMTDAAAPKQDPQEKSARALAADGKCYFSYAQVRAELQRTPCLLPILTA